VACRSPKTSRNTLLTNVSAISSLYAFIRIGFASLTATFDTRGFSGSGGIDVFDQSLRVGSSERLAVQYSWKFKVVNALHRVLIFHYSIYPPFQLPIFFLTTPGG